MTAQAGSRRLPLLEIVVFAAGLAASAAVGIAAYDRYGMYGDGPEGAGYRREEDPVSGQSRLVHETMTREGRLRRILGSNGAVVEIELDRDADGNVEECVKLVRGQVAGIGFSSARDGIIDAWAYRDANGQLTRIEVSTKKDHRVDRWEYYTNGALTRVEVDTNGDGTPDPRQ